MALALVRIGYAATLPTSFDYELVVCELIGSALFILVSAFPFVRRVPPLVTVLRVIAVLLIVKIGTAPTFVEIYWSGRDNPLADDLLARIDALLGLDWRAYVRWVDARTWLLAPLHGAYQSIWWQIPTISIVLVLLRQARTIYGLAVMKSLSLLIVSCVTWRWPAYGAYTHFGMSVRTLPHLTMGDLGRMKGPLDHLRAGIFDPHDAGVALVQFPSFHTAAALLLIWAAWRTPLRWPTLVVNLAMLASTPVFGSHYFTDMVAGAAVALVSIALVEAALDGADLISCWLSFARGTAEAHGGLTPAR